MKISISEIKSTFFFFIAFIILSAVSCKKDEETKKEKKYLNEYTLAFTYTTDNMEAIVDALTDEDYDVSAIRRKLKYNVEVYKITYKTHFQDSEIEASGLVCVPVSSHDFPLISFQNGTNTLNSNAPSVNPLHANYILLELLASNGYIVLLTDYIGFGSSADILHPYYHKESTNNAIIDLIRATKEFCALSNIDATCNDSLFMMGYSQGGGATLSAVSEVEHSNDLDMDLIAASCGSGAYDLTSMTDYLFDQESFPGALYLPYFIYSEIEMGEIDGSLEQYFKQPYANNIPQLFDGNHSNDEVNEGLTSNIPDLLTDNLINNYHTSNEFASLRKALEDNCIRAWDSNVRINFFHGTGDDKVPLEQSANIYEGFIAAGAGQVTFYPLPFLNHSTALIPWGIHTITWFNSLRD